MIKAATFSVRNCFPIVMSLTGISFNCCIKVQTNFQHRTVKTRPRIFLTETVDKWYAQFIEVYTNSTAK